MIISDLKYLETADVASISGAGLVFFETFVEKNVDIDVDVDVNVDKDIDSDADLDGNVATAEASADAFGDNSLAETETFAQATDNFVQAFSQSIAAVD